VAAIETARVLARRDDLDLVGVAARHGAPPAPEWTPPIPVRHLPLPRVAMYEAWHRVRRPRVERACGPVDVIHATTIAMPPRSRPLVLTIHDLAFLHYPAYFTRRGRSFFRRGLARALDDADLILCSSRSVLEDCRAAGFEERRLRHVPLGVDVRPATKDEVDRVRRRHRLDRPYVMWAGTVEPRKNLTGLLTAFRGLPREVDLVLVGPKGWNEDLDRLVAPVRDRVKVLGFVEAAERDALMAGARAFCFPSIMEGFGFPVLEAMGQGTPVVTSRGTSTEEVAGDAALLVDPREAGEIGDALRRILDDEALAAKLAETGRARAAGYTWDRTAARVADCYRELGGRS
jgi:glycosyltransferase involved in cell wall biosynthesis